MNNPFLMILSTIVAGKRPETTSQEPGEARFVVMARRGNGHHPV